MNRKWVILIALSLIWGSSFILIKKSLIGLTPFQVGSLRMFFASIFIFIVGFNKIKLIKKQQWKWIAATGFLGTFTPAFLFAIAETEIDSNIAAILNSLTPLNTLLFGFAIFSIRSTKRQILGVLIGFIGTAVLIGEGMQLNPDQNYYFAGFVILSTILYALNVNIIKKHLHAISALTITAGNFAVIIIPAIIVLIFSGFFSAETLTNPKLKTAIGFVVILSLFGTAVAKVLFNRLVQIASPVFATSVAYLMPLVAVGWGYLDGEGFSLIQGLATILILFGVYLSKQRT